MDVLTIHLEMVPIWLRYFKIADNNSLSQINCNNFASVEPVQYDMMSHEDFRLSENIGANPGP